MTIFLLAIVTMALGCAAVQRLTRDLQEPALKPIPIERTYRVERRRGLG